MGIQSFFGEFFAEENGKNGNFFLNEGFERNAPTLLVIPRAVFLISPTNNLFEFAFFSNCRKLSFDIKNCRFSKEKKKFFWVFFGPFS